MRERRFLEERAPLRSPAVIPLDLALLAALAALVGGALNSVAGGGSFFTFPALLLAGVTPVHANATSAVALWPGSVGSALGYREELKHDRKLVLWLSAAALAGGLAGALLLLFTPERTFARLVPFLLLAATLVFALGPVVTKRFQREPREPRAPRPVPLTIGQLAISVYGGYFGGGMGFMMLATYAALGMENVHEMNALKTVMAAILNAIAIVAFVLAGIVEWPFALVMMASAAVGGYAGARVARRVDPARVRYGVIVVGLLLSAYFFVRPA